LIDPAVKGTLNVLASCKKASSVKRVILTSSLAAVVFTENPLSPGVVVDEKWWSVPEICEKAKVMHYCRTERTFSTSHNLLLPNLMHVSSRILLLNIITGYIN
jgi:nucleoside-diphosphate-sugar epimerase